MGKFKGYENSSKDKIDMNKIVKGTKIVTPKNISPRIKLSRDLLYDHSPHGDPKGKWSRGELTHYENIRYGKWYRQDPARTSEITKRPTKMWKEYKPREYGYARFPTPVLQSNKKIVFLGCGPSSMGTIPWTMFSRPADYQMWVVEPRTQRSVYFPSKIYDIFYFNDEEEQISIPNKLNQIIYPKGYGDIYWHRWPVTSIDPDNRLLTLEDGLTTSYEFLVINTGAQAEWDKIENSEACLKDVRSGVFSLYYDKRDEAHHLDFKNALTSFKGKGKILFYTPETKFSHPSTSASLVNLTYEKLISRRTLPEISHFSPVTYTVGDTFVDAKIREKWKKLGIKAFDNEKLIKVDGLEKVAYFQSEKGKIREEKFNILHITPPMSAAPVIRNSPGLCDKDGWLDVDYHTFTHSKYPNIFGWGSGSNLPAPKTFFSSLAQTNNAILTMSYLTSCLEKKDFKKARNRNDFYGGEGYDVVHLGDRMTAVVGSKDGKVSRYEHFPYVWEAWDSQYDLKKFIESFLELAVRPDFYAPEDVYQLVHQIYPLEPSQEIVDVWNAL